MKEPILLIGNQGTAKNKLTDKILQLLRKERNYIQLHRDTTVSSLCLSPYLKEGKIVWEDSPLVDAVKTGKCLIIDEIDKAETEVVSVLRGLIEDKEMSLANGKRIMSADLIGENLSEEIIPMHKDFSIICLGNRAGFPFLGNAFVNEIGDIFSIHMIDNPDIESEVQLIKSYAPDVPEEILRRLSLLFSDLRELVSNGVLTYPISTRELIHVVKHLQKFRGDSVSEALENVLSFDTYDKQLMEHLSAVLHKHGISIKKNMRFSVEISKEFSLPNSFVSQSWSFFESKQIATEIQVNTSEPNNKPWKCKLYTNIEFPERVKEIHRFSELKSTWQILSKGEIKGFDFMQATMYVLTSSPMELRVYDQESKQPFLIDLEFHFSKFNFSKVEPCITSLPNVNKVVVFVGAHNLLLLVDPSSQTITPIELPPNKKLHILSDKVYIDSSNKDQAQSYTMLETLREQNVLVFFERKSNQIVVVLFGNHTVLHHFQVPPIDGKVFRISNLFLLTCNFWIVQNEDASLFSVITDFNPFRVISVQRIANFERESWQVRKNKQIVPFQFTLMEQSASQTFMTTEKTLLNKILFTPPSSFTPIPLQTYLHTFLRGEDTREMKTIHSFSPSQEWLINERYCLKEKEAFELQMEVIDLQKDTVRNIPVSNSSFQKNGRNLLNEIISIRKHGEELLTLQRDGTVSVWQLNHNLLSSSLQTWKQLIGEAERKNLSLTFEFDSTSARRRTNKVSVKPPPADGPKEGRKDNERHVGGNSFEGGSAGSDTDGQGGRGGASR